MSLQTYLSIPKYLNDCLTLIESGRFEKLADRIKDIIFGEISTCNIFIHIASSLTNDKSVTFSRYGFSIGLIEIRFNSILPFLRLLLLATIN